MLRTLLRQEIVRTALRPSKRFLRERKPVAAVRRRSDSLRRPLILSAASLLRASPLPSTVLGPPKRAVDEIEAWAGGHAGAELVPLEESRRFDLQSPLTLEGDSFFEAIYRPHRLRTVHRDESGGLYYEMAPRYVLGLCKGRAIGCRSAIVTEHDELLLPLSPEYDVERRIRGRHTLTTRLRLPRAARIRGKVAVLATLADDYFSHWMMDMLPRVALLEAAGHRMAQFDGVYLRAPTREYERVSLVAAGVPLDRIVDCRVHPHIEADLLVVPSTLREVFEATNLSCDYLNSLFSPSAKTDSSQVERLYVSRSSASTRRIVNEEEISALLSERGFTIVRPERMTLQEQVDLFARAEVIVASLGSVLANYVFCRPGATIIEIQNPANTQTCSLAIASVRGLKYGFLYGESTAPAARNQLTADMRVDRTKLLQVLTLLGVA